MLMALMRVGILALSQVWYFVMLVGVLLGFTEGVCIAGLGNHVCHAVFNLMSVGWSTSCAKRGEGIQGMPIQEWSFISSTVLTYGVWAIRAGF